MSDTPLVTIVDGQICLIKGHDTIIVTSTLPLTQVFYVLNFLTNPISAITHALFCIITFFSFHCVF